MSQEMYKSFSCECGVRQTCPTYVFAYWVNEVKRICPCGKVIRFLPESGRVIIGTGGYG